MSTGWLDAALDRIWILCPGCGIVRLSSKFGPVEDDLPPEDSRWDDIPVIHHGLEGCWVLGDAHAQDELGDALLRELWRHVGVIYNEPSPLHTAVTAP